MIQIQKNTKFIRKYLKKKKLYAKIEKIINYGEIMEFVQDNTIQKIKLLFVLERMEIPLTENNLIDICTSSNDWFTYLDLKEALYELIEVKFIYENKFENEESRYSITFDGRTCLSHFLYRIPKDIREKIVAYAQENRMSYKRSQEYLSEYSKNQDGSYSVTLKIKEPFSSNSLMTLKLKLPTRQSALETTKKWTEKAPAIYEHIFDTLLDS